MNNNIDNLPRWVLMWIIAGGLFMLGKVAVFQRARSMSGTPWPWWKVLAWFFAWPGMNARDFDEGGQKCPRFVVAALAKITGGVVLLWVVARHFDQPLAAGWCGMIGLILVLHFGVFDLLATFWQSRGFRAAPIMNTPIASLSVAEFWGRRWNSGFRDLAHPYLFVPAARRFGLHAALWVSFGVSGLAHELVISVPASGGYGLPTVYFLLQALGITLERRMTTALESHATRWFFTHAFTALPAFILFHPPFVERVMIPFFHAIGALS